jgi:hypothetical protein
MSIRQMTIPCGLESPVKLLHISDTHLSFADERDDKRKRVLAKRRRVTFGDDGGRATGELREAVRYAGENGALLVHTGDLIDFVSYKNLDVAKEILGAADSFFVPGNHEFSKYVGEAFEDEAYKKDSLPLVQKYFRDDLRFTSRVVGGVNLVGMDNVYYHMHADQFARLQEEARKGLPIVLLLHTPLYTPALFHEAVAVRGDSHASLMGCPDALTRGYPPDRYIQQAATPLDYEIIEFIKAQPLVKAVLAGHLHFFHQSPLTNRIPQVVAGRGEAIEYTLI